MLTWVSGFGWFLRPKILVDPLLSGIAQRQAQPSSIESSEIEAVLPCCNSLPVQKMFAAPESVGPLIDLNFYTTDSPRYKTPDYAPIAAILFRKIFSSREATVHSVHTE
jgi:hypothetical protein